MGRRILSTSTNDSKKDLVASDVAFNGSLTPGAGEMVVWVGSTVLATKNFTSIIAQLKRLRDRIIEEGAEAIAGANMTSASVTGINSGKGAIAYASTGAPLPISEDQTFIIYDDLYISPGQSKLFADRCNDCIDFFMEDQKDA